MKIKIAKKIFSENDKIADINRENFKRHKIFTINLMGSPGAGKTSFLEKSISLLKDKVQVGVIVGDITGIDDAMRINKLQVPVVQLNTGGACHLDANMINNSLQDLPLEEIKLLFIENVGNLVCPADFDLGENIKVTILSLTEGDDKPLKYPLIFKKSSALIINKIDLIPFLEVSIDKIKKDCLLINPTIKIFKVSCKNNEGIENWVKWIMTMIL
ncbi:MAG: hydrogenase nickel incorporation protein HypB [Thermodesulfovibrionales bacterium]|nr:hydrogenase nickel incorporation protein HypB [Thermodesulfovibrionales bacterium]